MNLEEYRNALLAFVGDAATPLQRSRVELACFLRQQLADLAPSDLSVKITNSLIRVLRELDGAKPRTRNFSKALIPLFPSKMKRAVTSAPPTFVSKRKVENVVT